MLSLHMLYTTPSISRTCLDECTVAIKLVLIDVVTESLRTQTQLGGSRLPSAAYVILGILLRLYEIIIIIYVIEKKKLEIKKSELFNRAKGGLPTS